jgi:hypothetical protein
MLTGYISDETIETGTTYPEGRVITDDAKEGGAVLEIETQFYMLAQDIHKLCPSMNCCPSSTIRERALWTPISGN